MKTKMILAAMGAMVMVGCSNEVEEQMQNNDRISLQITGGVEVQMTYAFSNQWEANDAIGVYMLNAENQIAEGVKNFKYVTTKGDGNFTAAGNIAYLPADGSMNVKAYYPQGNVGNDNLYSIDLANQEKQSAIDLMAAECKDVSASSPNSNLKFSHKLSKIILNITTEEGLQIGDLKVKINNQKTDLKYDVLNDALTVGGDQTEVSMNFNGTNVAEAIVAPNDNNYIATERTLTFTLNGTDYTITIPSDIVFEEGTKYTYAVNFKAGEGVGMELSNVTIEDWKEGSSLGNTDIIVNPNEAPKALYVIGGGCAADWDLKKGVKLTSNGAGSYSGEIYLNQGEIKIAQRNDTEIGAPTLYWYMPAISEGNVVFTPNDLMKIQEVEQGNGDYKWEVSAEQEGRYKLTVNINEMQLTAELLPKRLYVIGEGCPAGWDLAAGVILEETETGSGICIGRVELIGGIYGAKTIKIATRNDASFSEKVYWYMPGEERVEFTPSSEMKIERIQQNIEDNQWTISVEQTGTYDLVVNTKDMKMTATLVEE